MNKEKYKIIDEAYKNYMNYPLATIHDHHTNILYQNRDKGWCMLNGRSIVSPHPTRHLTKEQFINKCKVDSEFSERWGLKIEERELSYEERLSCLQNILDKTDTKLSITNETTYEQLWDYYNVPTKLITITYNDIKTEIYES